MYVVGGVEFIVVFKDFVIGRFYFIEFLEQIDCKFVIIYVCNEQSLDQ